MRTEPLSAHNSAIHPTSLNECRELLEGYKVEPCEVVLLLDVCFGVLPERTLHRLRHRRQYILRAADSFELVRSEAPYWLFVRWVVGYSSSLERDTLARAALDPCTGVGEIALESGV